MKSRKNIVAVTVMVLITLLLTTAWSVFADNSIITASGNDPELEWSPVGSWIARIPNYTFLFWRTITPQDLTGNRYGGSALQITYEITLHDPDATIKDNVMVSQTIRTSPNSFETMSRGA